MKKYSKLKDIYEDNEILKQLDDSKQTNFSENYQFKNNSSSFVHRQFIIKSLNKKVLNEITQSSLKKTKYFEQNN
jgi:hypothetical protein